MENLHKTHGSESAIVKFSRPVLWNRSDEETWMFNPPRRYILNRNLLEKLEDYVEGTSDLRSSRKFRPLCADSSSRIVGSRILVERYRERGIGDLLFLTGPLNYINHVTSRNVKIDVYALAERGSVLNGHPALHLGSTLAGPILYSDLDEYDHHWIIDSLTEYDEEPDQLNVYDALFKHLGFDPANIDPKWKRPTATIMPEDDEHLDSMFAWHWNESELDLRKHGYYVVAPFSNGSLRSLPYSTWVEVIELLAQRRPVVVIGAIRSRMPEPDISIGEFLNHVSNIPNVCNAVGVTPLRLTMALINKAECVVCLDSGPLYIAQALDTPAVSVWGPHHPGVRIGYSPDYMEVAVHTMQACRHSPCFAYASFPKHKCPKGPSQTVCEVLTQTPPDDIVSRVDYVESKKPKPLSKFHAAEATS